MSPRVIKSLAITRPADLPDELDERTRVGCMPGRNIYHVVGELQGDGWFAKCGEGPSGAGASTAHQLAHYLTFRLCKACVAELGGAS